MDQLAGHPLAMRVVLPKLEGMSAATIAQALRTNIAELGLNEQEEQGRLFATLRFVEQGWRGGCGRCWGWSGYMRGTSMQITWKPWPSKWIPARRGNRLTG